MGVKIKNGLMKYLNKIQGYKGTINKKEVSEIVGDFGVSLAKEEYAGKASDIQSKIRSSGVDIIARGKELAFMEYGTGVRGEGKYQGKLPTQTLKFESPKGQKRETDGWVYDYMKKLYNPDKPSFQGFVPQAQMFKTGQRLKNNSVVSDKIKEKIKKKILRKKKNLKVRIQQEQMRLRVLN